MTDGLRDPAATVGLGETDYSKSSGRTALALACEAIRKAVDEAGLTVADIDAVDEVALSSLGLRAAAAITAGVAPNGRLRPRPQRALRRPLRPGPGHAGMPVDVFFATADDGTRPPDFRPA